jgi:pimeloyl-ACP methyl ester carboxylesterase
MTPSFIEANGVRFAYFEEGTGPLVLLVHGFPDTAHTWDAIRPALAKAGYRAVTPFTRGYAPTDIPKDASYAAHTLGADVIALIDALGAKKAVVVGHDWGASAAYSAAAASPERVETLVTVAIPHPGSLPRSLKMLWKGRHFLVLRRPSGGATLRKNDFAYVDTLVKRWSPGWAVPAGETAAAKESLRGEGRAEAAAAYYAAVDLKNGGLRKRIAVPTVSFAGTTDILDPALYDRAASWFTGGYRVIKMPGGHFLHREYPERFATELVAALKSPPRP